MLPPAPNPANLPRPVPLDALSGILLIDKPSGPTSHDIVDHIRRRFRLPKVGHGGTLDPQATGLLVILIGKATKLPDRFMSSDKTYAGCLRLGIATDSQDAQGAVIREADPSAVTRALVEEAMARFRGDIMQTPPMVSAVKKDGVPLYKLARKGQSVERAARLIHVYDFHLTRFDPPLAGFEMRCTKGTYVRTICHELGDALGCGAHLAELRRTECAGFHIEDACTLTDVLALDVGQLRERIIPMSRVFIR